MKAFNVTFSPLAYEAIVYSDKGKGLSGGGGGGGGSAADKQESDSIGVNVSCIVMTCDYGRFEDSNACCLFAVDSYYGPSSSVHYL